MRILYLEHYAGTPEYGMEYRPYYLAHEWVRMGDEVVIVAASFSHLRVKQPARSKAISVEEIDGVTYWWVPTPSYHGNGFGRIRNILTFLLKVWRSLFLKPIRPFDVVIASSTYPFDNIIAHYLAKKWNAIHVYEVHDLWPLSPIELGGYSRHNPLILVTQISEDWAYKYADLVISVLPNAESYMRWRGLKPNKFLYIPNGIDVTAWERNSGSISEEGILSVLDSWRHGRFLVCYAGSHGIANSLDSFIEAAHDCPEAGFVLIGNGSERQRLMTKARGLENVLFLGAVPKNSIPGLLQRMDVLYLGLQRQHLFQFGISPNKLIDYMMAAKPIICAIDAGNNIIEEAHCGFVIPPEQPGQIVSAVRKMMLLNEQERQQLGNNGRMYVVKNHDYAVLSEKFINALEKASREKKNQGVVVT